MIEFEDYYRSLYGFTPYPYQIRFAEKLLLDIPPNCIGVPTGSGKESTAIAGFIWQWLKARRWRRLAYNLPARALTEQVESNTKEALQQAELLVDETNLPNPNKFAVRVLKGGAVARDWVEYPEQPYILIGTQDQFLSRSLNRGYAMSPYQWSIDFGLLSQDTLWIFDETQLMGAGFKTSIQLQGLRDRFPSFHSTHSIWLSATLDDSKLEEIADYSRQIDKIELNERDRQHPILKKRIEARKKLQQWATEEKDPWPALALKAVETHREVGGKVLIIVNQVKRAQAIATYLRKMGEKYLLVHSRFREGDRPVLDELKAFDGIIIATQTIEAGVDLDAIVAFSELCPWWSFVQRVGRCNRRGENNEAAIVYWIDVSDGNALPYEAIELQQCREILQNTDEIGIKAVKELQERYNIRPQPEFTPIPKEKDLLELFHTDEDLQGSRTDVSIFVRGLKEEDIFIGWRDFEDKPNPERGKLRREELCRVRIGTARDFLKGKTSFIWNWTKACYDRYFYLVPGMIVLLPRSAGGYSKEIGFSGDAKDKPNDLQLDAIAHDSRNEDNSSHSQQWVKNWVTLYQHSIDTAKQCQELSALLPEPLRDEFVRAGGWHDYGKAHPDWKCAAGAETTEIYAKIARWRGTNPDRPGIRHELASMLAARHRGESPLTQYLILCHHGKIRTCIEPWPGESEDLVKGIRDGDKVEEVQLCDELGTIPPQTLKLKEMAYWSGNWGDDVDELLEKYGPFNLTYLEALLRIADWRASAEPGAFAPDPNEKGEEA
ncbi:MULTISPECIES: CRISPR-associated helicase Cas3' [Spirulina sp. CCY15215]|uniref:type I-G CRISPR-associated helicase/endonuclease Cas3g n=1 Tax=Spirulina sp. CCY15215 TaxID=2767591 RepID=UPI001950EA6A|nr:CRISPR-associated helicase Cas3' [Spirulina major]